MSNVMQDHCVAALLRLHKKQIMRTHSSEDFIQVGILLQHGLLFHITFLHNDFLQC